MIKINWYEFDKKLLYYEILISDDNVVLLVINMIWL